MAKMRSRVAHTIFKNPTCAGSNSYYVDQHGDSAVLRPTSTLNAWFAQRRFSFDDYRFETTIASTHVTEHLDREEKAS